MMLDILIWENREDGIMFYCGLIGACIGGMIAIIKYSILNQNYNQKGVMENEL